MKLVEILARELVEWPERSSGRERIAITQDGDGELNYCPMPNPKFDTAINQWLADGGVACDGTRAELADDYKTAIITREMWQAELDRIAQQKETAVKSPKANKDGWIRHRGVKCPVEAGTLVDVRHRDGEIFTGVSALDSSGAEEPNWLHDTQHKARGEIMAWRPHNAEQTAVAQFNEQTARMPISCGPASQEGPIQWRDRIREIDSAAKEEEARHCAAMAAYDTERASLVAKLKAEGFVLVLGYEANSGEESVQRDIAQQDMSDPANWREGDVVEIVGSTNDGWLSRKGRLGNLDWDDEWRITFNGAEVWYVSDNTEVKWHSRPTT